MSATKKQPKGVPKPEPKPRAAKRAPPHLYVPNEQDSPHVPHPHDISYVDARPCNCRSPWCSRCYRKLYYPKIVAELKKFKHRNTAFLTCTFDPGICPVDKFARENGKIPYQFLIEKAPLSRLTDAMKRSKQKPRLEVIRYIVFLEFNRNGNPIITC